ncbi:hypothetical protein INR49_009881, partial [Caranx melampygus]
MHWFNLLNNYLPPSFLSLNILLPFFFLCLGTQGTPGLKEIQDIREKLDQKGKRESMGR